MRLVVFLVLNSAAVLSRFISAYVCMHLKCYCVSFAYINILKSPPMIIIPLASVTSKDNIKQGLKKNDNNCIYIEVLGVPVPVD